MNQHSDWMQQYQDCHPPYPQTPLTSEQQQKILSRALEKAGIAHAHTHAPAPSRKKRWNTRFWAVAAAVMLTLGGISVIASDTFSPAQTLSYLFTDVSQQQLTDLGISGYAIGQSCRAGDVTVTLDGAVGDRHMVYLLFTATLDPQYVIPAPAAGEEETYFWFGASHVDLEQSTLGYYIQLLSQRDHTLTFCLALNTDKNLQNQTMTLTLGELKVVDGEDGKLVEQGPWTFTFPLSYADNSIAVPLSGIDTPKALSDGGLSIKNIWISPFSVQIGCSRSLRCVWDDSLLDTSPLNQVEITLHLADGTVISDQQLLSQSIASRWLSVTLSKSYDTLIPIDSLIGISVGDQFIPIP